MYIYMCVYNIHNCNILFILHVIKNGRWKLVGTSGKMFPENEAQFGWKLCMLLDKKLGKFFKFIF